MNLNDCETFFTEASVFSNFYMYPFTYRGHIFGCSEQAFMFEKSEFFNDTASSIMLLELDTTDRHLPGISKSIGRK